MAVFSNRATLSYNGITVDSNIVTGEIVQAVTANKEAVTTTYQEGDIITYVISIVNGSNTAYTGLTATDNLGAYTFGAQTLVPLTYVEDSVRAYVNGTLEAAPAVEAGPPLSISGISLPAGGNTVIIYRARVNGFAPLAEGSAITNEAIIAAADTNGNEDNSCGCTSPFTPITVTETVTAESGALLSLAKSVCPSTVTACGEITYTLVITNTGNTPVVATDNASVTDIFNPILHNLTVTEGNNAWVEGTNYTYNEANGTFTTLPGQLPIPAASYTQDPSTGEWITTPGKVTITVTGTI